MRSVNDSKLIGGGIFLFALTCMALTFLHPGLRTAIGYGNGYGYPCETPADCDDASNCTIDICDPVAGCLWSCNATGPQDPCCAHDYCAENPICASGSCTGGAEASVN